MANKKKIMFLSATLLLSGLLLNAPQVYSEPVALNDRTMDTVTAGDATSNAVEGGGIVVGYGSGTVANRNTGLDLNGEAQHNAHGLNIVNSTESAVANVVNIWDGSGVIATQEESGTDSGVKINQVNSTTQEQVRSATLSGYVRSEADHTETLSRLSNESYSSKIVDHHDVTNILEETSVIITETNGIVDTRIKFNLGDKLYVDGHLGQGMAAAGHTEINFDGGSADIALVVNGGIKVGADTDLIKSAIEITGMDLGESKLEAGIYAEAQISVVTQLVLPKLTIVLDGAGCAVAMGSCNASSTTTEITNTKTDNSTLDIMENHQIGQSYFSEVQTSTYRSPFELKSAKAEYIVIDDSTLELNSDVTLELSDSAQRDIKGMNIVNAIGSNVANSTNVAKTARFEGRKATLVLNQFNTVNHGH